MEEIHLACQEEELYSILSVLYNGHDQIDGLFIHYLLQYFTTKEATILRSVCKEFKDAVEVTSWNDIETPIKGRIADWKTSFPVAKSARVEFNSTVQNSDFVHFSSIRKLTLVKCNTITADALQHVHNLKELKLDHCEQLYPGLLHVIQ